MELHQISRHCYFSDPVPAGDQPVMGLVAGACESLAVDCGNGPHRALWLCREAERLGLPPVRWAVLTHWHWDHIMGGRAAQEAGAALVCSRGTARMLEVIGDWDWSAEGVAARVAEGLEIPFCQEAMAVAYPENRTPLDPPLPNMALSGSAAIDLEGVTAELLPLPGDHSADGLVVRVPEDGVVYLGDAVYQNMYVSPWHYTGEKLLPLLDTLLGLEADWYLPAHHEVPMSGAAFRAFAERQRTLCRLAGADMTPEGPVRRYAGMFGAEPGPEELEELMAFVRGNIVRGR